MLLNNSYQAEFMCYAYGLGMFMLLYLGKTRWVLLLSVSVSLLYSLYFYYYFLHVRGAVNEIRYSAYDFSRFVDRFLIEHRLLPAAENTDSVSEAPESHEEKFGECVICMENFSTQGNPHTLYCPCKENYYHKICIREWLLKSATCPICRSDLKSKAPTVLTSA